MGGVYEGLVGANPHGDFIRGSVGAHAWKRFNI